MLHDLPRDDDDVNKDHESEYDEAKVGLIGCVANTLRIPIVATSAFMTT